MPEPKFPKGAKVKVNNRDLRGLVWYPKLEESHGETGTVIDSEYWSTYLLPGEREPTDVYNYEVQFSDGETRDNVPQVILELDGE
ncbi:MAG: hypothetical protein A2147_02815 [Chloroflexi bacterium RBG_16_57_8]|nr:MAG: hypothetical protein A2147_02815 [Chloroflexi bacterium RBG_16_57_8]